MKLPQLSLRDLFWLIGVVGLILAWCQGTLIERWEYKTVPVRLINDHQKEELDELQQQTLQPLGADGWELTAVESMRLEDEFGNDQGKSRYRVYYFKRRK